MKEENVMKKTIKSGLSKGVSAMLNRTLTSGANASSSYYFSQPVEPASFATVYKGNIIKNLIMDCQSYTKYRPNETTGGIFVSWRRKEELPTGA